MTKHIELDSYAREVKKKTFAFHNQIWKQLEFDRYLLLRSHTLFGLEICAFLFLNFYFYFSIKFEFHVSDLSPVQSINISYRWVLLHWLWWIFFLSLFAFSFVLPLLFSLYNTNLSNYLSIKWCIKTKQKTQLLSSLLPDLGMCLLADLSAWPIYAEKCCRRITEDLFKCKLQIFKN